MPSKKRVEPLDTFEADVPITAADNDALWRLRTLNSMPPEQYLEFLVAMAQTDLADHRNNTDSDEPFEL